MGQSRRGGAQHEDLMAGYIIWCNQHSFQCANLSCINGNDIDSWKGNKLHVERIIATEGCRGLEDFGALRMRLPYGMSPFMKYTWTSNVLAKVVTARQLGRSRENTHANTALQLLPEAPHHIGHVAQTRGAP